jgi:hypothetical protein
MLRASIIGVLAATVVVGLVFATITGCGSDGGSAMESVPAPAPSASSSADIIVLPTIPIQCDYVSTGENLRNGRGSCTCWIVGPDNTVGPMWAAPDCTPCGCIFTE